GALRGDLVLYNGDIHTMNADNAVVSVVAIKDGSIVYVGHNKDDALRQYQLAPAVINLQGRIAIPGLIDCHNHIVLLGNRPGYHTPLENAYSISDVQKIYKERAAAVPPHSFVTTIGGFDPNQFKEVRLPTLAELDTAVPDRPAFIQVGFSGPSATNTLGKAIFEALEAPPVILANGSIASGVDTGKALLSLRQNLTFEDRKRSTLDAMAYAASVGVTTHL
ncbi:hypothetical protein GQ53DRAFT_605361, partial [Thozetella sp. PMI_491]